MGDILEIKIPEGIPEKKSLEKLPKQTPEGVSKEYFGRFSKTRTLEEIPKKSLEEFLKQFCKIKRKVFCKISKGIPIGVTEGIPGAIYIAIGG